MNDNIVKFSHRSTTMFRQAAIPTSPPVACDVVADCRNPATGETRSFPVEAVPAGWVSVAKGLATYRNPETGETRSFPVEAVPAGWVSAQTGFANYRNPATGETKTFPVEAVPAGWVGAMSGLATCRNPATGETKTFPVDAVPAGWVGATSGHAFYSDPVFRAKWSASAGGVKLTIFGQSFPTAAAVKKHFGLKSSYMHLDGQERERAIEAAILARNGGTAARPADVALLA